MPIKSADEPRAVFPMRVVTKLTGLDAELVRAWERRYGAIEPHRTAGNARRYSQADIDRLRLLKRAVDAGHSIGTVARLSEQALLELAPPAPTGDSHRETLERYLHAISKFDLSAAEAVLTRTAQLSTPRVFALEVLAPILREVGARWHRGELSVAEEHAVSAQARALLSTFLRTANLAPGAVRILVATPEGHRHELGAMIAAVLATEYQVRPIYLGPDVPWSDLALSARTGKARAIVLSIASRSPPEENKRERRELTKLGESGIDVWLGAPEALWRTPVTGVRLFTTYAEYESALTALGQR